MKANLMHSRLIRQSWTGKKVVAALCAPQITSHARTTDERHKVTCEVCLEILWDEEIAAKTSAVTAGVQR